MFLPRDFENEMVEFIGKEEYSRLEQALQETPPTSLRINHAKADIAEVFHLTQENKVPWCNSGYYLKERPQFTFDPLLHSGCYYVQEASSMYLSHILSEYIDDIKENNDRQPLIALDLCAAPGGKSTLIQSVLPEDSLLISNEVVRQRANILAENIMKWGNPNNMVTNNYAKDFSMFTDTFDLIVCDVPCSGEGMFRKDPASIDEWSLENVENCCKLQREIVQDIWHTLKDNGIIIYSTCTYNPKEDDQNISWIIENLGAELLSSHPHPEWRLTETNTHFFPHKVKGEGFFIAVLRKKSQDYSCEEVANDDVISYNDFDNNFYNDIDIIASRQNKKDKRNKDKKAYKTDKRNSKQGKKQNSKYPAEVKEWITNSCQFSFYESNGTYSAFPLAFTHILEKAQSSLKIVHAGIELATAKGNKLQPCHNLALSTMLNKDAFCIAEIEYNTAIAYLRTEAIQLPTDTKIGYVLLTYKGHPLGFVNNIGSRANNLYPSEWKIKSTYAPSNL